MPEGIHDIPGVWLAETLGDLSSRLAGMARCGRPELTHVGSKRMPLEGGKREPDLFVRLLTHFDSEDYHISVGPRVILETAHSQRLLSVMEKAHGYLYSEERDTHAVIICDMSYPVTLTHDFKADISVWVRPETGDIGRPLHCLCILVPISHSDEDYPLEDLEHDHQPRASPPQSPEPQSSLEDQDEHVPDLSSPLSESHSSCTMVTRTDDGTKVHDLKIARTYQLGTEKICRRTEKAIVSSLTLRILICSQANH